MMVQKMKWRLLIMLGISFILLISADFDLSTEKLFNSRLKASKTESFEISFPLKIAARLPVEGRIVELIKGSDHMLFGLTESGKITGYNWFEKKVLWNFELPLKPLTRLLLIGKIILAVDNENNLLALSEEGKPIWPQTFGPFSGQIIPFNEKLILSLVDGSLIALEPEAKEVIWSQVIGQEIVALAASPEWDILAITHTGRIYQISSDGQVQPFGSLEATILPYASLFGNYLFFGTQDKSVVAWNLKKRKKAWSIQLGGKLMTRPLSFGKNLYVATSNAVVYCLNEKSGEIKWWQSIPSRSAYNLVSSEPYLIVATSNSPLLAFDLNTGRRRGEFRWEGEICASPLLIPAGLILSVYETFSYQNYLLFLEPDISVTLSASLASPQKIGTEITFTVEAVGFEEARYEFFLQVGERKEIVQKESARNSWTWLPLSPGDHIIGVRVKDKKKNRESTMSFQIIKDEF